MRNESGCPISTRLQPGELNGTSVSRFNGLVAAEKTVETVFFSLPPTSPG